VTDAAWIALEGAANVRDLGGLPVLGGGLVRPHRLIRADNLQGLTPGDVRRLVGDVGVRAVADLRTEVEVDSCGPGPLAREPQVRIVHLSLLPAAGQLTDLVATEADAPVRLPWNEPDRPRLSAAQVYLRYLADRPDSVIGALRLIAATDGATVVHCAAGKDRTGVVVALALDVAGVDRAAIVADYARSSERVAEIVARLAADPTYVADVTSRTVDSHAVRAETMEGFLAEVDTRYGGATGWLADHGWTDEDTTALRSQLT
jgi:protein-tyrosine phosphatase